MNTCFTSSGLNRASSFSASLGAFTCTAGPRKRRTKRERRSFQNSAPPSATSGAALGFAASSGAATKSSRRDSSRYLSLALAQVRPRRATSITARAKVSPTTTSVHVPSSKMMCLCVIRSLAQSMKTLGKESLAVDSPKALTSATKAFNSACTSKSARSRCSAAALRSPSSKRSKRLSACSSNLACCTSASFKPKASPKSAIKRLSKWAGS
mmetsp:Transcript_100678/g.323261  ORF Transcript_100678/g.323261 Transcript_100678/m.323261 type:complete len:211 (-) Transcript_100678:1821-2453(-)